MISLVRAYQPSIGQVEKLLLKSNESISAHIQKSHPIISDRPSGTRKAFCWPELYLLCSVLSAEKSCFWEKKCFVVLIWVFSVNLFSPPRYCFRRLHKLTKWDMRDVLIIVGIGGLPQSSRKHYKVFRKTLWGAPKSITQTPFFYYG